MLDDSSKRSFQKSDDNLKLEVKYNFVAPVVGKVFLTALEVENALNGKPFLVIPSKMTKVS
jgi:hypothetical protein